MCLPPLGSVVFADWVKSAPTTRLEPANYSLGGGPWTFHVAEGRCTISEQRVQAADLVMAQTPETFACTT
jgi:hypothetical protein